MSEILNNYYSSPNFRACKNVQNSVAQYQAVSNTNSQQYPNLAPLSKDTVSFGNSEQTKKQGLSKGAKWGIAFGTVALLGLGARFGYKNYLKKAYNNLKMTELPENLVFNPAKTKEEALKFTKETLKIQNVSDEFSLEELNFLNKAITDLSNKNKGKFVNVQGIVPMDKTISDFQKGTVAGVATSPWTKDFAKLQINREYFKHENLDKALKDIYYKEGKVRFEDGHVYKFDNVFAKLNSNYNEALKKYYASPEKLSLEEKLKLIDSYNTFINNVHNLKKGLKTGSKDIRSDKVIVADLVSENHSIYHEFGHLQDLYKNQINKHLQRPFMYDINARRDLFNFLPTKSHKEFLNTASIQETAGKVSDYAKTSIDEFIAETYAKLVEGEKLPDDVIALYKKYNGPMLG